MTLMAVVDKAMHQLKKCHHHTDVIEDVDGTLRPTDGHVSVHQSPTPG